MEWLADRPVDYSKFYFENACYVELNDFRRSLCKNELEIITYFGGRGVCLCAILQYCPTFFLSQNTSQSPIYNPDASAVINMCNFYTNMSSYMFTIAVLFVCISFKDALSVIQTT